MGLLKLQCLKVSFWSPSSPWLPGLSLWLLILPLASFDLWVCACFSPLTNYNFFREVYIQEMCRLAQCLVKVTQVLLSMGYYGGEGCLVLNSEGPDYGRALGVRRARNACRPEALWPAILKVVFFSRNREFVSTGTWHIVFTLSV